MIKKIIFIFAFFISITIFFGNCDGNGVLREAHLFPENLWGEWVRMDNGRTWYIASNYIKSSDYYSSYSYTFVRQSGNVIKVTEKRNSSESVFYLYASRIPTSSFKATIVKDTMSKSVSQNHRAIGGVGNAKVKMPNAQNPASSVEAVTDAGGNLEAEGIIAGDDYDIIIGRDVARVRANTDGDDVGTVRLISGSGLNFKTMVTPQNSSTDFMNLYANQNYGIEIVVTNTGTITASLSSFEITQPEGVTITGSMKGMLGTIAPGSTYKIPLTINCFLIAGEFEYKKLLIKIKDNMGSNLEWDDSVSLKFNKNTVSFRIRAMGRQGSNGSINCMVIVPGGKAYHFSASGYVSGTTPYQTVRSVTVPKYTGKYYLVVFSGATLDNETAFAFCIDKDPDTIASDFIPDMFYFAHNTEGNAKQIYPNEQIRSFLGLGNINYFKVAF